MFVCVIHLGVAKATGLTVAPFDSLLSEVLHQPHSIDLLAILKVMF